MSDLLAIGKSGVLAYRSALSATSDNVVNAETAGYTRRQVILKESAVSAGSNPLMRANARFGGVDAAGVSRIWDQFKAADARLSSADAGRATARVQWLTSAETSLNDGDGGVGTRLTAVFTAADTLAADPNGDLPRRALIIALDDAASTIHQTADDLTRTQQGITTDAQTQVSAVNGELAALAKVNVGLLRAGNNTSQHAQMADERDRLIDSIASKIGIDVDYDQYGMATVKLSGTAGATLVEKVDAAQIGVNVADDGRLSLFVSKNGEPSTNIFPNGGSLAGLVDVAANVSDRRATLDSIATDFATQLNDWQAQGLDPAGNPGAPLLAITGGASTLTLATTDPSAIAAASADGTVNGNLLALTPLRGATAAEARWAALIAGQSQILSSAKAEASAATTRQEGAAAALDEITGVDLDREAADLLRFQQAYSGSARIIQVARETLQDILNLF